jgi:hypothetical protein
MNEKKNGSITISNYSAFKSLCIFLLLCLSLSGCTLARPELQQTEEEELCGILVVVGEQEAEREQEKALEGKSFSGIRELEKALADSVVAEGTYQADRTFTFAGVEGHMLGIVEEETEGAPTTHFVNDGFFTKVKANTTVTDTGKADTISGTILAAESLEEPVCMYPVYHRGDGSYYTVLDSCGFLMGGVRGEGEIYSQSLQWEVTEEVNGKEEKNSREIKVSLEMAVPVEKVRVYMYNEQNMLLGTQEITKAADKVMLQRETAYIIVEEEKTDGQIRRSLYDWNEAVTDQELVHEINYLGTGGLIEPKELLFTKSGA